MLVRLQCQRGRLGKSSSDTPSLGAGGPIMVGGAVAVRAGADSGRAPPLPPEIGFGFWPPPLARAFMLPGTAPVHHRQRSLLTKAQRANKGTTRRQQASSGSEQPSSHHRPACARKGSVHARLRRGVGEARHRGTNGGTTAVGHLVQAPQAHA